MDPHVRSQIEKDAALLRTPGSGVKSAEWHFFESATGVGPSPSVQAALNQAGIKTIIHPHSPF